MNLTPRRHLVKKAEFARMCGCSAAAITVATRDGNKLADAFNGNFIDVGHRDAVAYLNKRKAPPKQSQGMPAAPPKKPHVRGWAAKNKAKERTGTFTAQSDPDEFLDMTLRELVDLYGTANQFVDWLKATKAIEDIRDKRLRNDEREKQYLPRDMVQMVVSEFVRCFHLQLTDSAKTIATQIQHMTKAGQSVEDCIVFAQKRLGSPIQDAKKRIADHLAECEIEI